MRVLMKPRKSLLQKVEMALNEFYDRSIYKKMAQDFTRANGSKYKKSVTIDTHKKNDTLKQDINDDLPGMLFI